MYQDEFHHCPCCQRRTRHRISRERKLAPVLWCQSCFHVQVGAVDVPPENVMAGLDPAIHAAVQPLLRAG